MSSATIARFMIRRIFFGGVVLLVVSSLVFLFVHIAPGSPEQALVTGSTATPEVLEAIRQRYQLDQPLIVQYATYMGNVVTLDFGESYRTREAVADAVGRRAGITLPLLVFAFLVTVILGTALAAIAAYRQRTGVDRSVTAGSIVFASAPPFALAVLVLFVFAETLGWFPVVGSWDTPLEAVHHLALPALTLGLAGTAPMMLIVRAAIVETLDRDYVLFARARGISEVTIFVQYVLRNSLVAATTAAGVVLVGMISAVAFVEHPFNLDGLGTFLLDSVLAQDIPVIQALTLLTTAVILLVNLLVDLSYSVIDARIELGASR